jgi:predicted amidophosphoribosyltransferase
MIKYALYDYIPQRDLKRASFEDMERHRRILDFKDGRNYAVKWAARELCKALSLMDLSQTVLVFIPACCKRTNDRRFKKFSAMVCERLGCENGFDYVQVVGKRRKAHIDHVHELAASVQIDETRLAGKTVVLFDDIVTSCKTANAFIDKIIMAGANVRMAIFLAKTKSFRDYNRIYRSN